MKYPGIHLKNRNEMRWVCNEKPQQNALGTVLYPPRVIPCGIHGMGGGFHGMGDGFHGMVDGFHTFGGWIPWNGGWIPYLFQVDSIPSRWIPYLFQVDSILLPYGIQVE